MKILSEHGYPRDDELLVRVDYYIGRSPNEGGILIVGKDSQGREYESKNEQESDYYVLPSGLHYMDRGRGKEKDYPALFFPFQLTPRPEEFDPDDQDEFYRHYEFTLLDECMQKIPLDAKLERAFKELAIWAAWELHGALATHFWGETYGEREPYLERFLERFRKQEGL